jgi:NAD(P)-dependent dehydrogenase (short-subunit alcohol dehydrogenase family)
VLAVKDALFDFSKEIVVITGVSGQLGNEYAHAFLQRGAVVCGLDVRHSVGSESLAAEYHESFQFFSTDILDKAALNRVLQSIQDRYGVPTALINNAALDSPPSSPPEENGPFEDYPVSSWDKVMEVNVKGTFLCCQVFGGAMAGAGRGSIINISSIYGVVSPDQSIYEFRRRRGETFFKPVAYSASKSSILNLTRYLAVYWATKNVRVNTLTIAGVFNNQEQDFLDAYCGRIPVGRMAQADEYNGAVLFLASEASRYMTGSNLVIDGGWTAI